MARTEHEVDGLRITLAIEERIGGTGRVASFKVDPNGWGLTVSASNGRGKWEISTSANSRTVEETEALIERLYAAIEFIPEAERIAKENDGD